MNGARVVEVGLKAIVLMIDLGFFICFLIFLYAACVEMKKIWEEREMPEYKKERTCFLTFFLISFISAACSIVLSGLIIMPWWS